MHETTPRSGPGESIPILSDESVANLLATRAARHPDGIYGSVNGVPVTFGALDRQASAFAAAMQARGIANGDRVAVMLRNTAGNLAVIFGLARAGIAWVPVNVRQRGAGLAYLLTHSRPDLLVVESDLVGVAGEALAPGARLEMLGGDEAE